MARGSAPTRPPGRPLAGVFALAGVVAVAALAALAAVAPSARAEVPWRAAWGYDLPDLDPPALDRAVARLTALGVTRLFLSVEDGPRFRLDDAEGRDGVARVLEAAGRRGLAVEAMLLQDSRFLDDRAEALRRVAVAARFGGAGVRPFDGLHIDVEPHTLDAWECGGEAGRARLVRRLAGLAADVRDAARLVRPLPVSVAVPWWSLDAAAPGGRDAARALARSADTLVLMAYGEPGGPLVAGEPRRLLCRLRLPEALADLPGRTRLAVGLAGYEFPDAAALERAASAVDARLAASPRYAGSALFLDGAPPGTPLVVSIRGRVVDAAGRGVPDATVAARSAGAGAARTTTNACGRFVARLASPGAATLVAEAEGLGRAERALAGLVAGREREAGTLVLAGPAPGGAVPDDPARPPFAAALARAWTLAEARNHDGAQAAYLSVLDRWPGLLEARLGLARLDAWQGRYERAAARFRAILADRCDAAEAHLGLGDLARWAGRLDESADHYQAVSQGWPHEPAGPLGLARVALDRGRPADALPLVERALALDPSDADARALRARALREAAR